MTLNDLMSKFGSHDKNAIVSTDHTKRRNSHFFVAVVAVLLLILIDQVTKAEALKYAPKARHLMASPDRMVAIAWHLHSPDRYTDLTAICALGLATVLCLLPVPGMIKVLWASAAISNHVEMFLRPGTMDFLAFRFMGRVCVANVADIYIAVGIIVLTAWTIHRIRIAKTLYERV